MIATTSVAVVDIVDDIVDVDVDVVQESTPFKKTGLEAKH